MMERPRIRDILKSGVKTVFYAGDRQARKSGGAFGGNGAQRCRKTTRGGVDAH